MSCQKVVALVFLWMVSWAASAQQSPEECLRPSNWAERTLCGDNELMTLHLQLQRVYNERRAQVDGDAFMDMVSYHHGWLRGREECRTAPDTASQMSCLRDLYQTRIAQLSGRPAQAPAQAEAPRPAPDPALLACRGDSGSWVMELGAQSARLRLNADAGVQGLRGRLVTVPRARTSVWRGKDATGSGDTVIILMEGACALEGAATRYPLMARLSLPDGSLLAGCCQRVTPATGEAVPVPGPDAAEPERSAGGLLAIGTPVRLRDVDGPNVALRKSARISSGNVLVRVRAGTTATVEQAANREGTGWYFVAVRDGGARGWVMSDLVEPLVAVAVKGGVDVPAAGSGATSPVPVTPRIPPAVPGPEPAPDTDTASATSAGRGERGFDGPMATVGRQWWSNLTQHLPVIDACIERARLRTARIVRVDAHGADTRHIYARDGLKNRVVCVVRKGQPVRARVLDRDESFPQTAGPMFTRAPGEPPAGNCYRNQRVNKAGTRVAIGWLSYLKPGRRCR